MRTIVAGSRDFTDYELAREHLRQHNITAIISGAARGADRIGERYAREYNIPVLIFPADWDRYGKSAGYKRNAEMAEYGEQLIAFWDGESKGTRHMINLAREKGLKVVVINYAQDICNK